MLFKNILVRTGVLGVMIVAAGTASAQNYPTKPIRIVTAEIGGGTDFTARVIAQGLSMGFGQQTVVDNRPAGVIPGEIVSRATPDGYTLLVHTSGFWIGALLQKTPYDPIKDFLPITMITRSSNVLALHPSVPVTSVPDLIALAKAKPGVLNYGTASSGGTAHLAAELFKSMAGVNMVRIQYKGSGPAVNGLMGGEVQLMFATAGSMVPFVKSGKLKALAVTSTEPFPSLPGVPTVAQTLPGYECVQMYGMFAPAKTPDAIIKRLNQESIRFLRTAEAKQRFSASGVEAVGSSPQEFANAIRAEMTRMGKVIKDAGIRAE